jgi:phosphoribosylanthranilate isomerase
LAGLKVIRAVRLETGTDPLAAARRWLAEAAALGAAPDLVIIDAAVPRGTDAGHLGGTGATVDWAALASSRPLGLPTALAGGLTPENVAQAIHASKTAAVDTASGVEASPGRKDPEKARAFVAAARMAMAATVESR